MAQKPSIPKGTRDFGHEEMARRNYIFDTIRSVFRLYGFNQIETMAKRATSCSSKSSIQATGFAAPTAR